MTKGRQFPNSVLRFYGNVDFALDTLGTREITLINVSLLNDPFDPYFFFETDFEEDYKAFIDYVSARYPRELGWFLSEMTLEWWQQAVPKLRAYFKQLRQRLYVFSTSAVYENEHPKNNLYMWGHYANGHRGVAIEFNTVNIGKQYIDEHNKKHGQGLQAKDAWQPIDYEQRLPLLTREMLFDFAKAEHNRETRPTLLDGFYSIISQTKSLDWKSENEWRILWSRDDTARKTIRVPISETAIESVYIGMSASSQAESDVRFEVRRNYPAARLFKAQGAETTWCVRVKFCDYTLRLYGGLTDTLYVTRNFGYDK